MMGQRWAVWGLAAFLAGACAADVRDGYDGVGGDAREAPDVSDAGVLSSPPLPAPKPAELDAGAPPAFDEPPLDDSAADAGAPDPCQGYPAEGICVSPSEIYRCLVPTGSATPALSSESCSALEHCVETDEGAACEPKPGLCDPGASECDGDTLRECDADGAWHESTCELACKTSALGAFCATLETLPYEATIEYAARGPNDPDAPTGWTELASELPARGLLVVSLRGETLIDATITDESGHFELEIPSVASAEDEVLAFLVRPGAGGVGAAFAVMQPDVGDEEQFVFAADTGAPEHWLWSIDPAVTPSGGTVLIDEDEGSPAVHVFQQLRAAYEATAAHYGVPGEPLVVWLRMNTSWSCGACFFRKPKRVAGFDFTHQIVLPATAQNTEYWGDAVSAHELGHWVMSAYGTSPDEGGPHCVGVATFPGQAWSEGWATAFSSLIRGSELYFDKQSGTFFWVDLAARAYSFPVLWKRASVEGGLLQRVDEFEVSAMLWELHDSHDVALSTLLDALASPRMKQAPFARGYARHTWKTAGCTAVDVTTVEGETKPMFADYLDALRCAGLSAEIIDAVTDPDTHYPYPSAEPLCH